MEKTLIGKDLAIASDVAATTDRTDGDIRINQAAIK